MAWGPGAHGTNRLGLGSGHTPGGHKAHAQRHAALRKIDSKVNTAKRLIVQLQQETDAKEMLGEARAHSFPTLQEVRFIRLVVRREGGSCCAVIGPHTYLLVPIHTQASEAREPERLSAALANCETDKQAIVAEMQLPAATGAADDRGLPKFLGQLFPALPDVLARVDLTQFRTRLNRLVTDYHFTHETE